MGDVCALMEYLQQCVESFGALIVASAIVFASIAAFFAGSWRSRRSGAFPWPCRAVFITVVPVFDRSRREGQSH